ncbi:LANO_0A05908g1_1 [Lachancea nothofagi CBS 11611]|uniref:LANO_0A05908g1_1 n=1 Tax=Lachancea nothofagi CBS 11611 TaxID=1266666 RepID=A0A1G4IRF3_9SACH|nr:LANO_0A05908g1_1 [Lachancea nothofagi CBS 11611]
MKKKTPTKIESIDFGTFILWRTYLIDQELFFGSVADRPTEELLTLCLSTVSEQPLIIQFDAEDINEQAFEQGIVVESANGISENVFDLVRNPSAHLQISLENRSIITLKSAFDGNVELKLSFPIRRVDQSQALLISRCISEYLFNGLSLQGGLVGELRKIILQRDMATNFLASSIRDLGFESVLRKWAPVGSFNNDTLQEFRFDSWLKKWSSKPSDLPKHTSHDEEVDKMMNMIFEKAKVDIQSKTNTAYASSSINDDFGPLETGGEQSESFISNDGNVSMQRELIEEQPNRPNTYLEPQLENEKRKRTDDSTEPFSKLEAKSSETPATQLEDASSRAADGSPSKKKRKFGKVRVS